VSLDSTARRLAGIEIETVGASTSNALTANGIITFDANRVSVGEREMEPRLVVSWGSGA